jgi:hypothetical protein
MFSAVIAQAAPKVAEQTIGPGHYINMGIGLVTAVTALIIAIHRFLERKKIEATVKKIGEALEHLEELKTSVTVGTERMDDLQHSLEIMPDIQQCLDVMAKEYESSVSYYQANDLVFNACATSELVIRCWLCRFIRAGKPAFDKAGWDPKDTVMSQFHDCHDRLRGFAYKGIPLEDFLDEDLFTEFSEHIVENIRGYENMEEVGKMISNRMNKIHRKTAEHISKSQPVNKEDTTGGTTNG